MEAGMRGEDRCSGSFFSYVDLEERVPARHPLRLIREIVNDVLDGLSADFDGAYAAIGRPSIAPEKLLRALLLQAFYSIRSERQLMEHIDFNMLFRWFVGLGLDDGVWDASTFCQNRDRLLEAEISARFLNGIVKHAKVRRLLSRDHFSVDGTLIEAWASMKSFRPKDGGGEDGDGHARPPGRNAERDFHGEKRANASHESTTDPEARLYRKSNGQASRLCFMGHALMENRNGLVVGGCVTRATGTAEREAALALIDRHRPGRRRITLGADKGYDVAAFVDDLRDRTVTPHVAVQTHLTRTGKRRKTRIDDRATRHPGYAVSLRIRKRIEEVFGWTKVIGGQAKTRFRGRRRIEASFTLGLAAYNLIRLPRLLAQAPP
jgi:transposase